MTTIEIKYGLFKDIDKNGRAKVDIALAKGKKEFDKRQTLKEKEDRREMDRAMKIGRASCRERV